jgi:predicted NACHT family NTPase
MPQSPLAELLQIRSRLSLAILGYLSREMNRATWLPPYFPRHLREIATPHAGFHALRRRVRVITRRPLTSQTQTTRSNAKRTPGNDSSENTFYWDAAVADDLTRAIILGEPGAGKSWILRYEAHRLAFRSWKLLTRREQEAEDVVVPIRLHLSDLHDNVRKPANGAASLEEILVTHLTDQAAMAMPTEQNRRLGLPESYSRWIQSRFERGYCILLLDAWDEIRSTHDTVRKLVEVFLSKYPDTRILITSRDAGYDYARPPVADASEITLQRLDQVSIDSFCATWFAEHGDAVPEHGVSEELALLREAFKNHATLASLGT